MKISEHRRLHNEVRRWVKCYHCDGTGETPDAFLAMICPECGGYGQVPLGQEEVISMAKEVCCRGRRT